VAVSYEDSNETSGSVKGRGIFRLAVWLVTSQVGLCSVELFIQKFSFL